ncbi:MAG TPA: uracil-DNA glycosylase [Longimicrobiales bacterium]|nr:uracil-DNA glycosylase [Longimicrobiales bacterium]
MAEREDRSAAGRSVSRRPEVDEGARLLGQRIEMGEREIFLEGLTREEALALARAARSAAGPVSLGGREGTRDRSRGSSSVDPATRSGAAGVQRRPTGSPGERELGAGKLPALPSSYEELREVALSCTRCRLAETRTQVVFSDGVVDARLVVVGEAPGANEDRTGLPFVGAAGKFLDLLLRTADLSREDSVYICNVLKCRPPGNRNPLPAEIEACAPFLQMQLGLIRPEALLAVGSFAAQLLTGKEGVALGKLRGEVHSYRGIPLVCTYHPAALLRNPKWTRAFWDDLQLLRQIMDGA